MQSVKTIEFWNEHHKTITNQEWIVQSSSNKVIQVILNLLLSSSSASFSPDDDDDDDASEPTPTPNLLEIGCGTSELSKEIYKALMSSHYYKMATYSKFVITDISPICIELNKHRDEQIIHESNGNFNYYVLDVIHNNINNDDDDYDGNCDFDDRDNTLLDVINNNQPSLFNVILDKGCLDTFLFRSERSIHIDLAERLLNRIHTWTNKYYVVLSPRSKIKVLRDFQGFTKIERYILDDNLADLEGTRRDKDCSNTSFMSCDTNGNNTATSSQLKKQVAYLYICWKNHDYVPGVGPTFVNCYEKEAQDDINNLETICKSCGLEFQHFRQSLPQTKRIRQWKGHRNHCQIK